MVSLLLCYPAAAPAVPGEEIFWTLMMRPSCVKNLAGFETGSREIYQQWRAKHAETVARMESQAKPLEATAVRPDQVEELRVQCEQLLGYMKNDVLPADPRLASPEGTWKALIAALRAGDKIAAADCFIGSAKETYVSLIQRLTPAQMAEMADSFTGFQVMENAAVGKYREAAVVRGNAAGIATFIKTNRGWLITQL
jgi:hypothetical protein